MESTADRIKDFTSNIIEKIGSVKYILLITVLIAIIILAGYFLSFNVRTNKKVEEVLKTHKSNIRFQTDYCHKDYRKYSLVDFHIKSSINPAATGFKKFDYLSLDMIYQVLRLGTRYLEFEIFAKEQNNDSVPVISVGSKTGDWKMTANVLDCEDVFSLISINGFSQKLLENYRDPLFIFLNIKTDNVTVLNKLAEIIEKSFKIYLLDKTYQYQRKNIAESKICDLLDKVVIMSSKGYLNTDLEKIINISTDSPALERLSYKDLIVQKKFNVNQPDFILTSNKISFHKGITNDYIEIHDYNLNLREMNLTRDMKIKIGNSRIPQNSTDENLLSIDNITDKKISFKKHESISFTREELGNTILVQGFSINEKAKNIEETNKVRLTIVVPDYDIFSANFNPKNIWYTGTHFVAMNFQTLDENMEMYMKFFGKRAIRLKQSSLLNDKKDIKNTNYPTNKVVIDKERKFNSDCEEIEDSVNPTTSSRLSTKELNEKLSNYDTELKTQKVFNVHFDFLKNNLSLDVHFQPKFNPEMRLVRDNNDKFRMSMSYQNNKGVFQVVLSNNKKIPNSVQILRGDSYLSVDQNKKLTFIRPPESQTKTETEVSAFLDNTTFLLLEPTCGKEKMCSIGHVTYENVGDNKRESTPILNYLKVKTNFSTKNRIYKYNQTKYKKILTLHSETVTKNGKSEVVEEYSIWRPFTYKNFYPVGDVIFKGSQIPTLDNDNNSFVVTDIVSGAVKHPTGYEKVISYSAPSSNNSDRDSFVIWKPIAPDGYISMGYVTVKNGGDTPPLKTDVVCVGANFVKPSDIFGDNSSTLVSNSYSKYNRQYINNKVSFWKGKNINYFVATNVSVKSYDRNNKKLILEPPLEFDFPIFEFQDFSLFSEDLVFLDKDITKVSDREAACFKFTVTYKAGEFSEYNLYNGLHDMPDRDSKIVSYVRNRNNANMCVSLPSSYWSNHYKEISSYQPDDENTIETSETGKYNYLTKFKKCPSDKKEIGATVYATQDDCYNIGGYMTNTNKFKASISSDKTAQCYLDICNEKTDDTIFMNKSGACGEGSKLSDAKIQTTYSDCMNMGGEYSGSVEDANKIVKCKIDVCKRPTKFQFKLPSETQDKGALSRATYRMEFIPGEKGVNYNCDNFHVEAEVEGNVCQIPLDYSSLTENTRLNVGPCRDTNYFGTSYSHMSDNSIRLRDNKEYCLTAQLDGVGNPLDKRSQDKSQNSPDNSLELSSCKSSLKGQQFIKDNNNNIRYKSNNDGITNLCLTSEYDNSLRLNKCNPLVERQKWIFENMPSDYCLNIGSIVYYFKKVSRVQKFSSANNILNLPVENLLQEEFDYNHFHLYVRGRIESIENNIISVKDLTTNKIEKYDRESQMNDIILEYTPPLEKLELGTKVIAKNGSFSKQNDPVEGTIYYNEASVKWYGVVTKKLKNGNYKVFFSINSIEPDQRNKKCSRPDYSMVKEIPLTELYLLRNVSLC